MKITKSQLRQIIKEEVNEIFAGYSSGGHPSSNVRGSSYGPGEKTKKPSPPLYNFSVTLYDTRTNKMAGKPAKPIRAIDKWDAINQINAQLEAEGSFYRASMAYNQDAPDD